MVDYTTATPMPPAQTTQREKIVQAIIAVLQAARFYEVDPSPTGNFPLFEFVERGERDDVDTAQCPMAFVEEGLENMQEVIFPKVAKTLDIYVGIRLLSISGVDSRAVFNYYLGRVTQVLTADRSLGGLCLDMHEVSNSREFAGKDDPTPGGVMIFEVRFRHQLADPFTKG